MDSTFLWRWWFDSWDRSELFGCEELTRVRADLKPVSKCLDFASVMLTIPHQIAMGRSSIDVNTRHALELARSLSARV